MYHLAAEVGKAHGGCIKILQILDHDHMSHGGRLWPVPNPQLRSGHPELMQQLHLKHHNKAFTRCKALPGKCPGAAIVSRNKRTCIHGSYTWHTLRSLHQPPPQYQNGFHPGTRNPCTLSRQPRSRWVCKQIIGRHRTC